MNTLLKIENLSKSFGKTKVLKNISLNIQEGEIISVLGPSGCGKSTLLRIISGILPLDEGKIFIRDKIVSDTKVEVPTEKRDINMVFQDFALWPHMKVCDNILYGLKIKKLSSHEMQERLNEVENLLHLNGLSNRYPAELSGGQQQRVAIARALITKPSIVLLDEPLCNLDIQLRVEMRTEMAYLFKQLGTTVFHVTHDPSEAFAMADRIIIMNQGEIDQIDTPINCYISPQTTIVAGLLGAGNKISATITSELSEYTSVTLGNNVIECKSFINTAKKNDVVQLRFRPESAKFTESKTKNSISVEILISTFEGNCYRIKAKTEKNEVFTFLHESQLPSQKKGFVTINKEDLYAYDSE